MPAPASLARPGLGPHAWWARAALGPQAREPIARRRGPPPPQAGAAARDALPRADGPGRARGPPALPVRPPSPAPLPSQARLGPGANGRAPQPAAPSPNAPPRSLRRLAPGQPAAGMPAPRLAPRLARLAPQPGPPGPPPARGPSAFPAARGHGHAPPSALPALGARRPAPCPFAPGCGFATARLAHPPRSGLRGPPPAQASYGFPTTHVPPPAWRPTPGQPTPSSARLARPPRPPRRPPLAPGCGFATARLAPALRAAPRARAAAQRPFAPGSLGGGPCGVPSPAPPWLYAPPRAFPRACPAPASLFTGVAPPQSRRRRRAPKPRRHARPSACGAGSPFAQASRPSSAPCRTGRRGSCAGRPAPCLPPGGAAAWDAPPRQGFPARPGSCMGRPAPGRLARPPWQQRNARRPGKPCPCLPASPHSQARRLENAPRPGKPGPLPPPPPVPPSPSAGGARARGACPAQPCRAWWAEREARSAGGPGTHSFARRPGVLPPRPKAGGPVALGGARSAQLENAPPKAGGPSPGVTPRPAALPVRPGSCASLPPALPGRPGVGRPSGALAAARAPPLALPRAPDTGGLKPWPGPHSLRRLAPSQGRAALQAIPGARAACGAGSPFARPVSPRPAPCLASGGAAAWGPKPCPWPHSLRRPQAFPCPKPGPRSAASYPGRPGSLRRR